MSKKSIKNGLLIGVPLVVILVLAYLYFKPSAGSLVYNFVPVQTGDIKSQVSASGAVQAASDVQLAFERAGKVDQSLVKVGDTVKAGQTLATLSASDVAAQLAQAQAAVLSAQAQLENARAAYQGQLSKLQDMRSGASAPDLNLSQAQVTSATQSATDAETNYNNAKTQAQIALNNQYSHSVDLINAAYSSAFDAINTKLADLFTDPQTSNPKLVFNTTDSQLEITVRNNLVTEKASLGDWNNILSTLDPTNYQATDQALSDSLTRLNNIADFLRQINILLSDAVNSSVFTTAILNLEKNNVNAGLANVNASILALNGQKQVIAGQAAANNTLVAQASGQLDQAKNAVIVAQKAYALKKFGATADQISAQTAAVAQAQAGIDGQTAAVAQAQANVQNARAQLSKSSLLSPLDGIISQDDAKTGEIISPNVPIIFVISQAKYQIVVPVSEANIANIKIGQSANVTLDAYGANKNFSARVITIDPASTMINGVAAYKVTLEFSEAYPQIKAGLSANAQILTAENKSALIVPSSAIIKRGSNSYVITNNDTAAGAETEVNTGLVNLNGQTEIINGLQAGQMVATFGSSHN
jgi:RND family efflux transporter MFP subunit